MKKFAATLLLFLLVSLSLVGAVAAAESVVHNPKNDRVCIDEDGKWIESKNCDPTTCGCLFHAIEEFIKELF